MFTALGRRDVGLQRNQGRGGSWMPGLLPWLKPPQLGLGWEREQLHAGLRMHFLLLPQLKITHSGLDPSTTLFKDT